MKTFNAFLLTVAAAALPATGIANTPLHTTNTDQGVVLEAGHGNPSVTRAQIQRELAEFRRNPTYDNQWVYVGGERGWEQIPHSYAFRDGRFVHTDSMPHNLPRANTNLTVAEREMLRRDASSAQ